MALEYSQTRTSWREAPHFSLPWVDGGLHSPSDFSEKKWLAVIFTCNHCPFAVASWPIIVQLQQTYQDIWFIAISSNDVAYVPEDSFEHMWSLAQQLWLNFPYVYDESQEVAEAYDAACTPDNYLFKNVDGKFELFFQWRFNDNWKDPSQATQFDFETHIKKMLTGEQADETWFPSIGCSIKWK